MIVMLITPTWHLAEQSPMRAKLIQVMFGVINLFSGNIPIPVWVKVISEMGGVKFSDSSISQFNSTHLVRSFASYSTSTSMQGLHVGIR